MARPVLIDASWWFGGNRTRGIGAYLDAYFRKHCPIVRTARMWLLPPGASETEGAELVERYGGQVLVLKSSQFLEQRSELASMLRTMKVESVFFPSPFERPWSLIDFLSLFLEQQIRTEATVFDLLPLQFPTKILALWTEADQLAYRDRVIELRQLDFLWAISPATQKALHEELSFPLSRTKVLRFGLKPDWLEVPQLEKISRDAQLVLTISGGEWRKNLEGTLTYFAAKFPQSRLVVICKLGLKHRLRLQWQCLKLGVFGSVKFVGEVGEQEKWRHLSRATTFLFLSRAEGLGIPLLEAQRAAIPRIIMSKELIQQGFGTLVKNPEIA